MFFCVFRNKSRNAIFVMGLGGVGRSCGRASSLLEVLSLFAMSATVVGFFFLLRFSESCSSATCVIRGIEGAFGLGVQGTAI